MKLRKLKETDVVFSLTAEQDDLPVRGNAMASGDDAADRKYENEINQRLDDGDVWAWAAVTVTATWFGFKGRDHLGGCTYEDEEDFKKPGGYYDDMKAAALADLQRDVEEAARAIKELEG